MTGTDINFLRNHNFRGLLVVGAVHESVCEETKSMGDNCRQRGAAWALGSRKSRVIGAVHESVCEKPSRWGCFARVRGWGGLGFSVTSRSLVAGRPCQGAGAARPLPPLYIHSEKKAK